jgi:hypothetical protein
MILWMEKIIQLVNQWNPGRDFNVGNIFIIDILKMFDQGPQTVAVRGNENSFAVPQFRDNCLFPVWQNSFQGIFQGFGPGRFFKVLITRIVFYVSAYLSPCPA